jgi:hypothetical protein
MLTGSLVAAMLTGSLATHPGTTLVFASPEAVAIHLSLACDRADGVVGVGAVLRDGTALEVVQRTRLSPWGESQRRWELAWPDGTHEPLPVDAALRLERTCSLAGSERASEETWADCLILGPNERNNKGLHNMSCVRERHEQWYGPLFLPYERVEPSLRSPPSKVGHRRRFGEQGQPRSPVRTLAGCPSAAAFFSSHAMVHRPLVMRGCANLSAAPVETWTDEHLTAIAPAHQTSSESCNMPLASFLAMYRDGTRDGSHPYRRCSELPTEMLAELPVYPFLEGDALLEPEQMPEQQMHDEMHDEMGAAGGARRGIRVAAGGTDGKIEFRNVLTWMHSGANDQQSKLHYDMNHVILTQLSGRKSLLLVAPSDSLGLYADFLHDPFVNKARDRSIELGRVARADAAAVLTSRVFRPSGRAVPGQRASSRPRRAPARGRAPPAHCRPPSRRHHLHPDALVARHGSHSARTLHAVHSCTLLTVTCALCVEQVARRLDAQRSARRATTPHARLHHRSGDPAASGLARRAALLRPPPRLYPGAPHVVSQLPLPRHRCRRRRQRIDQ